MYEILYQRVFSELDRRENSFKQNLTPDTNNVSTTFYQNGFGEDDGAFKDDGEDNTGWTEVKSRSSKGWLPSRGGGGHSHTLPILVCAAQRGRDFEAPNLERGIHFRGVF